MRPARHNKSEARASPYDIFKPPGQDDPPKTPEDFLDMVKSHHEDTRAQRFLCKRSQDTCEHCCKTVIDTKEVVNKSGCLAQTRTPLIQERHQALDLVAEIKRGACVEHQYATNEQLEAMERFRALIDDKSENALLRRLAEHDARRVQVKEMEYLIQLFLAIFFQIIPSDEMQVTFAC
jgi:hypothetical protein